MERKELRNRISEALKNCDEFELRSIALACLTGITVNASNSSYHDDETRIINSVEFIAPDIKDIFEEALRGK